jgi:N-acetyl-gamma-glutamyl-phosphate reductase
MTKKIEIGIIGSAGYTGGELIRLLLNHPHVNIAYAHSRSNANQFVYTVHTDLVGETVLKFTDALNWISAKKVDVLFLCLGHGASKSFLSTNKVPDGLKIIDLANDFRLHADANYNGNNFVYGLPELNKNPISNATYIANPGCFATAIQLAILPLAANNCLQTAYVTGITGSTGAGQGLAETSHFSFRANNIQAYKTLTHQHLNEIQESVQQVQHTKVNINFVPWRGNFTRGIFVSVQTETNKGLPELIDMYNTFYKNAPFVVVSETPIALKQVVNTNKCLLQLELQDGNLVIHSAIDNLVKGAAGQAIQNLNIMFKLEETAGLKLKATSF